jgi:hypothetical protein
VQPKAGSPVFLLGYKTSLTWSYAADTGTVIQLPEELQNETNRPCKFVYGFEFEQ